MELIHPSLNRPVPVVGVICREFAVHTIQYDAGPPPLHIILTPKDLDVEVTMVPGAAEDAVLVGETVTITFVGAASTLASLAALVAGKPLIAAVLSISGDAGTIPVTFAGGNWKLWEDRVVPPVLTYVLDKDGNGVPSSTDVVGLHESDDDTITVDLTAARVSPGSEILTPEGASISGRSLAIQSLSGTVIIRLDWVSVPLSTLLAAQYGTIQFVAGTKKFIRTVGDWTTVGPAQYNRAGTRITVAGSTLNDGTYTAVSATATDLIVAETVADEIASAVETITGLYPKRAPTWLALAYPNMIELTDGIRRFSKVFVENTAQAGCQLILVVGKE